MWDRLAPRGDLHRIELLDDVASIHTSIGNDSAARDAARHALSLIRDRNLIDPAMLAHLESLAPASREAQ